MSSLAELKQRILSILPSNCTSSDFGKINQLYKKKWHQSIEKAYRSLRCSKTVKKLSKILMVILGEDYPVKPKIEEQLDATSRSDSSLALNLTTHDAEKQIRCTLAQIEGCSKHKLVTINDDEAGGSYEDIEKTNARNNAPSPFNHCHLFKNIHIVYAKFRLVALMRNISLEEIQLDKLNNIFIQNFCDPFFSKKFLQHYVSKRSKKGTSSCTNIKLFLEQFCSNIFCISQSSIVKARLRKPIDEAFNETYNELLEHLERTKVQNMKIMVPYEMYMGTSSDDIVDVARAFDRNGIPYSMLDFPTVVSANVQPVITISQLDMKVNEIRNRLCDNGELVHIATVSKELCEMYGITCLKYLRVSDRLQLRSEKDIPALLSIMKEQSRVNAFIHSFVTCRNVCTLHELEKDLCNMVSKSSFDALRLGPLRKQLLIWDYFQFPMHAMNIPKITSLDVFNCLWKFIKGQRKANKSNASAHDCFSLDEFMTFFAKKRCIENPFACGVRISSMWSAASMIKKARHGHQSNMKEVVRNFNDVLQMELKEYLAVKSNEFIYTVKKMSESFETDSAIDCMNEMYNMLVIMKKDACVWLPASVPLVNFSDITINALHIIKNDPLMSKVFRILLAVAPLKAAQCDDVDVLHHLGFKELIFHLKDKDKQNGSNSDYLVPISKSCLLKTTKEWIQKSTDLSIHSLNIIEKEITMEMNAELKEFHQLGHGSFLNFLLTNKELSSCLKDFLKSFTQVGLVTSYIWKNEDIQEFVTQCGPDKTKDEILEALNQQLATKELLCLPETEQPCVFTELLFHYQQALFCGDEAMKSNYEELSAIACEKISAVPFMKNIGKAIEWHDMFQPTLGIIKLFIAANFKSKDLPYFFLEINENNLLKVEKDFSVGRFTQALLVLNPAETCHRLVSIICFHGSVENAPLQLLSGIVKKSIESSNEQQVFKFCLECFLILPFYLLCATVVKVFIKPLSTLYGDRCVPQKLLQACWNDFCRERLQMLGHQLSIKEWIEAQTLDIVRSPMNINPDERSDVKVTQTTLEVKGTEQKDPNNLAVKVVRCIDVGNQQAFVEQIRKRQFGVGVVLGEEEMELLAVHREREGRSLQRLSNELYSKDSHFVLELIQNADDNEYTGDETPALVFVLENDRVNILNNEVGFTEKNISALCDIGKSTKQAHKKGYIGQKGIGFKSVFRVTDCPEVHSNGFHIKFDATSDPNGYILPQWTEEISFEIQTLKSFTCSTCIVLPLKQNLQCLSSRFHDIHPSLLLFLNRLETIIIDDKITDSLQVLRRERVDENVLRISQNNESCLWFVVTEETPIDVTGESKVTDISFAFPLLQDKELPRQLVFAYLPLRSYGFRFIIQADFEVPSSREDIHKDSAWNQCILHAIPRLAVKAFQTFMRHPQYKGIEGVVTCLKFFDFKDEIVGVFRQVARAITRALQQEECMPIISDGELKFALPSTTVFYSSVISPSVLFSYAGVSYVHPLIEERVGRSVLKQLGVKELSLEQLFHICNGVVREHKNSNKPSSSEMHKWIGEWLNIVFLYLQKTRESSESVYHMIRSLSIFPMNDLRLVNLVDSVVFFPPDKSITGDFNTKRKETFCLIEDDLNILSRDLMKGMEGLEREHVTRLLQNLGVKKITPLEIIHGHILPMFKQHKHKSDELLVAWVVYIQHHYQYRSQLIDTGELRTCLVLLTNFGRHATDNTEPVFFSSAYASSVDLPPNFPSVEWCLLSDAYLKGMSQFEKSSMKLFLEVVGVRNPFTLQRRIKQMDSEELKLSCWKNEYTSWPSTTDGIYAIEDQTCEVSSKVLSVGAHKDMRELVLLLDRYWNERYNEQLKCQVKTSKGQVIGNTFSSFYSQVRNSCWLFTDENLITPYHPKDLFHRSKQTYNLLSSKVFYISKQVQSLNFLSAVGVCTELTAHKFMEEFNKWRFEDVFNTTYGHIISIYRYFHEHKELLSPLLKSRVVFLPCPDYLPKRYDDRSQVSGNFFPLDVLCWENPCHHLRVGLDSTRVLNDFYPNNMKYLFLHDLSVRRYPPMSEFLELAQSIASQTTLPNKPACDKLFTVFSMLGEMCISESKRKLFDDLPVPIYNPENQYNDLGEYLETDCGYSTKLFHQLIFPLSNHKFVSLSQRPLLSTNESLTYIYQEHIPLISLHAIAESTMKGSAERKLLKIMLFFKACGIELLSDLHVEPEVITVDMKPACKKWENILNELCPIIQRFLAAKQPLVYKHLCARDFQKYLSASKTFSVNSLETVYRLKGRTDVNISRLQPACVKHICASYAHVYINRQHEENYDDVMKELVKLFVANEEKEILLDFIITYNMVENKDSFLKRKRIVPVKEDVWYFTEFGDAVIKETKIVVVATEEDKPVVPVDKSVKKTTCWPPREAPCDEASIKRKLNFPSENPLQPPSKKVFITAENTVPSLLDVVYEDVVIQDSDKCDVLNVDDCHQVKDKSAGELGEGIVYQHLCTLHAEEIATGEMNVIWLNQTGEQGQPYDLQLVFPNQARDPVYIEVKSSYRSDKQSFEISSNQLQFAFKHRENFHLIRVTGLKSKDLKIRRLANLNMYLENKSVRLYMML